MSSVLAELGASPGASQWKAGELEEIRRKTREDLRALAPLQIEIVDTIRAALDEDAIMVAGTTEVSYWGHLTFPVLKARSYLTSSYFANLGYAFPTALGAKVGNPGAAGGVRNRGRGVSSTDAASCRRRCRRGSTR